MALSRNDQISIDWHNASIKAGTFISETAVPACSTSDLCERCASLNLHKIFQQRVETKEGNFIINLGRLDDLLASTCALCRLFGSMATFPSDQSHASQVQCLRAVSVARVLDHTRILDSSINQVDTTALAIVHGKSMQEDNIQFWKLYGDVKKTGFLCPVQTDREAPYYGVHVLSESVDVDFVKKCMSHCRRYHHFEAACNAPIGISMKSFRLIDCTKRLVVEAPLASPYVALSYVWGAPKNAPTVLPAAIVQWSPILGTLPKTIEDAIEATLQFGLQYLWIDRYCIDQSNPEEKQDQVSNMDLIYASAELTIIAAAGKDPHYGLPGVNKTKRTIQPSLRVGNITIASKLSAPRWSLDKSTWSTRAWTYQEGLLSKRRLIFTPQQTYFECNNMHIAESESMPLNFLNLKQDGDSQDGALSYGIFGFSNPGSSSHHLSHFISVYSNRSLTYPEDALSAMKGIFAHFGKLQPPVDQLMGIPMISYSTESYCPTSCFLAGLAWFLTVPKVRRVRFPSWTWAGWAGQIAFFTLNNSINLGSDIRVWMENMDGSLSIIPKNLTSPSESGQQDTRLANLTINYIRIEANTFDFQLKPDNWDRAEIDMGELGLVSYGFFPDRESIGDEVSSPKTLTAIVIWNPSDLELQNILILGVEDKGTFAERIGIFRNNQWNYDSSNDGKRKKQLFVQFFQTLPKRTIRLG